MYDEQVRIEALDAMARGESLNSISKWLGVSRLALRAWRDNPEPRSNGCPRCSISSLDRSSYAHLLGWYLGDGCPSEHRRRIELAEWQREVVAEHPELLLRGLFNSDGCRAANWATRTVGGVTKRYEYPRYQFSNESVDIMQLCQQTLSVLGIPWRMPRRNALSVAQKAGVARLDEFVGPKT
ncbi:transcriptional regulator [Kribbella sp. NPDC056345]|uniref:transcriptional regulator n=1 Tax=Kribbella sp. NPDC056345 TaxID=3345789 RepID=UPI0035D9F1FC